MKKEIYSFDEYRIFIRYKNKEDSFLKHYEILDMQEIDENEVGFYLREAYCYDSEIKNMSKEDIRKIVYPYGYEDDMENLSTQSICEMYCQENLETIAEFETYEDVMDWLFKDLGKEFQEFYDMYN